MATNWLDWVNEAGLYGIDPFSSAFDPDELMAERSGPGRFRAHRPWPGAPPFFPAGSAIPSSEGDIPAQSSAPTSDARVVPTIMRRGIDPNDAVRSRASKLEKEWRPRKKRELVTEFAQPLLQSLAAAIGQPGYRRNRTFWSSLIGGGGNLALSEVMRLRAIRQAELDQALREAAVNARVMQAMKPGYWESHPVEAIDKTGKKVFTTPQAIRESPGLYNPPDAKPGSPDWNFQLTTEEAPEGTIQKGWWVNARTQEIKPASAPSTPSQSPHP